MADHHIFDTMIESGIRINNFVTALMIAGCLIGAVVIFGGMLIGRGGFETETGWKCLGFAAFAYLIRRVYPPFVRFFWGNAK